MPAPTARPGFVLRAVLAAIGGLAVLAPAILVRNAPHIVPHRAPHAVPRRVVPKAELPPVEPVAFEALDPDDARAFNAGVPLVAGPIPAARPFRLAGDEAQRARAIDCMAAAVLYEAGDDTLGQRSVAQVVINRARHPAFPKTICGVVFQGSERTTGCQFTFTCDGALVRHRWSDAAWVRARATASAALAGKVFAGVGYATHYHTNWVVPYWQSSLDKIATVETHLFFRWTGWWGTAAAFNRSVSPDEPVIPALVSYSPVHRDPEAAVEPAAIATTDPFQVAGDVVLGAQGGAMPNSALDTAENSFLLSLDTRRVQPDAFLRVAQRTCGARPYCKIMAWTESTGVPAMMPLTPGQTASMAFSYLRDRSRGFEKALWNCGEFRRPDPLQCMKVQVYLPASSRTGEGSRLEPPSGMGRPPSFGPAVPELLGVRRRPEAAPMAKPTPPAEGR